MPPDALHGHTLSTVPRGALPARRGPGVRVDGEMTALPVGRARASSPWPLRPAAAGFRRACCSRLVAAPSAWTRPWSTCVSSNRWMRISLAQLAATHAASSRWRKTPSPAARAAAGRIPRRRGPARCRAASSASPIASSSTAAARTACRRPALTPRAYARRDRALVGAADRVEACPWRHQIGSSGPRRSSELRYSQVSNAASRDGNVMLVEDVQCRADTRRMPINRVGIKDIRHPVRVKDRSAGEQHTVATFNMYVNLPHNFKGTHMSRFVEILHHEREISVDSFRADAGRDDHAARRRGRPHRDEFPVLRHEARARVRASRA